MGSHFRTPDAVREGFERQRQPLSQQFQFDARSRGQILSWRLDRLSLSRLALSGVSESEGIHIPLGRETSNLGQYPAAELMVSDITPTASRSGVLRCGRGRTIPAPEMLLCVDV